VGEPRAGCDPTISEWGNPAVFDSYHFGGGHPGN